jgi:ComF family protein
LQQTNLLLLPEVARGLADRQFDRLYSLSWYQLPWSHFISQWKFQQDLACGELLQQQLQQACQHYQQQGPVTAQAVCFVPVSQQRLRQRGFNQAQVLAATVARGLQLPLLTLFAHSGHQTHQLGLNRQQRRANLRRQFRLLPDLALPPQLLLIDDVITTGATVNQLCRLLRRAGVQQIEVWTLAITAASRRGQLYSQPQPFPPPKTQG